MAEIVSLADRVAAVVRDGDTVAMEGFTHPTCLHPGASLDKARQATGWPLAVAGDLTTTDPPSQQELEVLRRLEGSMA